mmetsp:Transcript_16035/g.34703  ORF Transcript_16035/g.34703 Transcript_16035/m.34703 type:complete len:124 (+) Transcript_16035:18-389(+)
MEGNDKRVRLVPRPNPEPTGDAKSEYAPFFDFDALESKKKQVWKKNPFVFLGALSTVGILAVGLYAMKTGNARLSQRMMRARLLAQGGTVGLLIASTLYLDPIRNGFPELAIGGGETEKPKSD